MWYMLHPDMQGIYVDVGGFIMNMGMRPHLKGWVIGSLQIVSQWASKSTVDLVGTEKTYSNAAEIPVTFVYSTTLGEIEQSQMMNAVAVNNDLKFFIRKIKPPTLAPKLDLDTLMGFDSVTLNGSGFTMLE